MMNYGRTWLGMAAAAILAMSAACGGDDTGDECLHCPTGAFQLPEGGEIRLELIQYPEEDGTVGEILAGQSFFFRDQTPELRPLDGEQGGAYAGTICYDFTSRDRFDNGYTEEGQAIVDTRTYIDVGSAVTVTSKATGNKLSLAKTLNGTDPSSSLQHDIIYLFDDASALERNVYYDVDELEGTAEYPGWDLRNGETVLGTDWKNKGRNVFIPPDFGMTSPSEADFFAGIALSDSEDFVLAWGNDQSVPGDTPENIGFVAFYKEDGSIASYCFQADGATSGNMTVPKEVIAVQDAAGGILFGKFTHIAWNQGINNKGRFDLLGVNCKFTGYEKAAQ
jgi:hypothetical protein